MSSGNSTDPVIPGLPSTQPPPPDEVAERCHLLGPTALIVQAIMGIMVLGSLVAKRHLEKRKRPWRVWMLDVGKQLVGQAALHALNILISMVVGLGGDHNPCSLYFLNILIDTTVGVAIFYFGLKAYTSLFINKFGPEGFKSGHYGQPPQWQYWFRQLQPYLSAVLTMKLIVLLPLTLPGISNAMIRWGQSMLGFLSLDVQVIFVLAIFPVIMNVFQFCVMDQLIKGGKGTDAKRGESDEEAELEGYEPVPTREADGESTSPRRRHSQSHGSTLSLRSAAGGPGRSSRASSIASLDSPRLSATEDNHLLDPSGSGENNVWAALSRRSVGDRSPRHAGSPFDDGAFVDEPEDVILASASPVKSPR